MPIACLALAALAALGFERVTTLVVNHHKVLSAVATGVVLVVLALDLRVPVFGAVAADEPNKAYAAIRGPGRLLELPVFRPDVHFGSAYLGYGRRAPASGPRAIRRSPRGRPSGSRGTFAASRAGGGRSRRGSASDS